MATLGNPTALAQQARRAYAEGLLNGMPTVVQAVDQGARVLLSQVAEGSLTMKRRDAVQDLNASRAFWLQGMTQMLRSAVRSGAVAMSKPGDLPLPAPRAANMSLVDDDTIENEILS